MQLYSVHREMKPTQSFKRFKQDKLTFSNLCLFIPTVLNVYLKSLKDIFCIIKWLFRSYSQITRRQIIRQTFLFFQSVMSIRLNMVKKKRVLPTRVVWSRDPLMMSSSLESRQPTSWLWPESSTLLPAALLCTRILPSLFNNRKVESLPFPCVSQSAQVWPTPHNKQHYRDSWLYEATIFQTWFVTFHHWSGESLSGQSDTHPPCDPSRSEMGYGGVSPYLGTVCALECQRPETERETLDPAATTAGVWGQETENTGSDTTMGI